MSEFLNLGLDRVVEALIEHGLDVNGNNYLQWTPLHTAAANSNFEIWKKKTIDWTKWNEF